MNSGQKAIIERIETEIESLNQLLKDESNKQKKIPEIAPEVDGIANKILSKVNDLSDSLINDEVRNLRERERKWQEVSINQLSYFNNLLIVLGTGFLGFAFKDSHIASFCFTISDPQRVPTFTFLTLLCMSLSVLFGLFCGYNRLHDFRYTHRAALFRRRLYAANQVEASKPAPECTVGPTLKYWNPFASYFDTAKGDFINKASEVKTTIDNLSQLVDQLGRWTRGLLITQWAFFIIAIVFFFVTLV